MPKCRNCGQNKSESEFYDSRPYWCKSCVQKRARETDKSERNYRFVWLVLLRSCCVDCGEEDERVLEFDHVEDEKKDSVVRLAQNGYSLESIRQEMKKCEIVCRNCHKRRTMSRQGGWRQRKYMRE